MNKKEADGQQNKIKQTQQSNKLPINNLLYLVPDHSNELGYLVS